MEEYSEFFNIPEYYTDITSNIHSKHLLPLFKQDPIDYMRTLYSNDNEQFYNVRDELILRGIGFRSEYQNNFLLDRPYNIEYIIYKEYSTNAFEDINFSLIGASNLTERFNIKSDRFFHGVPLEGVLHFTRGASVMVLKDMFKNAGFSIIPVQDFIFQQNNEGKDEHTKEKSNNYEKQKELPTLTNPPPKDTTIDDLFDGTDYKTFRTYCKENNVEKFSQLTIDFVRKFEHQKYIRRNTAEKVFDLYEQINERIFNMHSQMEKTINMLLDNPFKKLMDFTKMDYTGFINKFYLTSQDMIYSDEFPFEKVKQLNKYIIENKEKRNKEEFKELVLLIKEHPSFIYIDNLTLLETKEMIAPSIQLEKSGDMLLIECFSDFKYKNKLKKIYKQLDELQPISIVLDDIIDKFRLRDIEVLEMRQTKTLQEVGDIIGVSRERVRQIQSQITKQLARYIDKLSLDLYIHYYGIKKNRFLSVSEFMKFYDLKDNMYTALIHLFFEMEEEITYVDELDLYIETKEYKYVTQALRESDLEGSIIEVEEIKECFPKDTEEEYMQIVELLLEVNNYKRVNRIYVEKSVSMIERINYLFDRVITKPLEMNDEGYIYFKKLMVDTFGIPYDSSKRAATARVADGENVILVDGNTYFYHHKDAITNKFLYELEEVIDEELESYNYADPRIIYKRYQQLMNHAQIRSPAHLYSIVQIYLEEKYETGHRSSLHIFKGNTERLDAESILLNYLIKHGHEVNKDTAIKDLNWKEYKMDQLLGRIQTVLLIKDDLLKTIESFDFQQNDLMMLEKEVRKFMKNGYAFINDLQFEIGFNEHFSKLIQKYNLSNEITLIAILKWLLPDLSGHSKLLYWEHNPINNLEEVITYEHPDLLTREEISQFVEAKGYSKQTFDIVVSRLTEEKYFYHYTTTQYINSDQLHLSEEVKESLSAYLADQMRENNYMSVYSMVGFTNKLKSISKHEWTEWLIYQFAKLIGYKQIQIFADYRYNQLILVKDNKEIERFDQLVVHIVKTEYTGRYHERDLARFLVAKNLLYNPRQLPSIIHQSLCFKFDSFGFFELRSCDDVIT